MYTVIISATIHGPSLRRAKRSMSTALGCCGNSSLRPKRTRTRWLTHISNAADNAVNAEAQPVLLVTPLIRPHLAQIITRFLPTVPVISQAEIPPDIRLQSVGTVDAD